MIGYAPSTATEHFRRVRWKGGMVVMVDDAMNVTRGEVIVEEMHELAKVSLLEEFMRLLE